MNVNAQDALQAQDLNERAIALIRRAVQDYDFKYGSGTMSCAAYDTAWVSLVTKTTNGAKYWLFPECFDYLLRTQASDGSWGKESNSQIDGILSTAAALLSLLRHVAEPLQVSDETIVQRTENAALSLCSQLSAWRVSETVHVGYELIVPTMLSLLQNEAPDLTFDFEDSDELARAQAKKLSKFKAEHLYTKMQTTAIHSLEAFVGIIDFDKVAHHKLQGSMMGSPSATAAYLMNATNWDEDAEAYLKHVIQSSAGQGSGGVPSAYPSTYFEYTWVISTLMQGGFAETDLECPELAKMTDILTRAFRNEKGVIGFDILMMGKAPHMGSDVDDTAKGILSLGMLGIDIDVNPMIEAFETDTHFQTYPSERDPSFSANCNVLITLLHQQNASLFAPQILKTVRFLCETWWNTDGQIKNKWNTSHLYPSVLLVEAYTAFWKEHNNFQVLRLIDDELVSRFAIAFFQACLRTMLQQHEDGSWDKMAESTAHGVLILCEARKSALFGSLQAHVDAAISRGVKFLVSNGEHAAAYCWVEKVSYASPILTEAYVLSALKAANGGATTIRPIESKAWTTEMLSRLSLKPAYLFRQTPLFSGVSEFELHASIVEASLFQPLLRRRRLLVFPRKDMEKDKYFDLIPLTWTACNNRSRAFAPTAFLYEMMIVSFLNYQADEFMEAVAGPAYLGNLDALRKLIDCTISSAEVENSTTTTKDLDTGIASSETPTWTPPPSIPEDSSMDDPDQDGEVASILARFTQYILERPGVAAASAWSRKWLRRELRIFLQAHITQTKDNIRFSHDMKLGNGKYYASATESYFCWVRSTSADHTSCPYAFSFVNCLLSSSMANGGDCFGTMGEKYLGADVCRHLATMCRMYNDYGSVSRDQAEGNLNSLNFTEFDNEWDAGTEGEKAALFRVAEYERSCLDGALSHLEKEGDLAAGLRSPDARQLNRRRMVIWRMFCDVTDLFGQLYVVRDLASRMG
ncbi:Copalyl diphosphate synthase [Nemania sp. FL0031]|nr:Copalyl diphosphate synthase [Nemania sp. FL0031]